MKFGIWTPLPHTVYPEPAMAAALRQSAVRGISEPDLAFEFACDVVRKAESHGFSITLVAELCRVASRAVILDYSDSRSFNQLYGPLFSWKKAVEGNTRTFHTFKPGEVAAEAARHGFGRPAERRQFFLPMVVHRAMKSGRFSRTSERASAALGLTRWLGSPIVLGIQRETR